MVATFRDRFNIRLVHRDAADLFLDALDGVTDPEAKRKTIGRLFIDVFERGGGEARRRGLSGAGHAVSGRDRERQLHRRALGDDQVASQCRWPAGTDAHEAGRAAARVVQGRGARAGPRAGHSRNDRRAASVSRVRAWRSASRARSRGRSWPCCARRTAIFLEEIRAAGSVRCDLAGVRRVAAGAHRGRDGRRAHLRQCLRAARGDVHRWHDRGRVSVRCFGF